MRIFGVFVLITLLCVSVVLASTVSTNNTYVLLDELLSENATTDYEDFLDKDYGIYYELDTNDSASMSLIDSM